MRHDEHLLQKACVAWFRMQYPQYSRLYFAVPNGGARTRREGLSLKEEGVMAGVADTLLLLPRHGYSYLAVEFKTPSGKVAAQQKSWAVSVRENGGRYEIIRNVDDFIALITDYLSE